ALPELVRLDRDAARIDLDDEATGSVCRIEVCLEDRVHLSKEGVDFLPPLRQEFPLPQERLCLVLETCGVSASDFVAAGLGLDPRDAGHRTRQLKPREAREVLQERALISLLGAEERGPLLKFQDDEGLYCCGQAREERRVGSRQCSGVARQACVELHG